MFRTLYLTSLAACSLLAGAAAADTSVWFDATIRFDPNAASFDESGMVNKVTLSSTLGLNTKYDADVALTLPAGGLKTSLGDTLAGVTIAVNKVGSSFSSISGGSVFLDGSDAANGSSRPYIAVNNYAIMKVTFSGLTAGTYSLTGVLSGGYGNVAHGVFVAPLNWEDGVSASSSNNSALTVDGLMAKIPNPAEDAKGDAGTSVTWENLTVGADGTLTLYYEANEGGRGGFEEIKVRRIPEPSAVFLGVFGAAALAFRRRRASRIARA